MLQPYVQVPLFVISPWSRTKGGAVYSEVCDHTSVIQFIEQRHNVTSLNISPWRRTVAGDLTAAFDFTSPPDLSWPTLPDTSGYVAAAKDQCDNLPSPTIPAAQSMPSQEEGTKVARPLPYSFHIDDSHGTADGGITIKISNVGAVGAAFSVHDYGANSTGKPMRYTVGAGKSLSGNWNANYNISLHGPNGFVRIFHGDSTAAKTVQVRFREAVDALAPGTEAAMLQLRGTLSSELRVRSCKASVEVRDNAYGHGGPWHIQDGSSSDDGSATHRIPTASSGNWYDLSVTTTLDCQSNGRSTSYTRRYMGKIETKHATVTDPAMARYQPVAPAKHPKLPDALRMLDHNGLAPPEPTDQQTCREVFSKDACYSP